MTPQPLKVANMAIISLGSEMKKEMCKTLDVGCPFGGFPGKFIVIFGFLSLILCFLKCMQITYSKMIIAS